MRLVFGINVFQGDLIVIYREMITTTMFCGLLLLLVCSAQLPS